LPNSLLNIIKTAQRKWQGIESLIKEPYTNLYLVTDNANWVIDNETRELARIAAEIGVATKVNNYFSPNSAQCVYYTSRYTMSNPSTYQTKHRIAFDYYHGLPRNDKIFAECFDALCKYHEKIHRVRVSHSQIEKLVLSSGIEQSKVFRIPIGINLEYFQFQTLQLKKEMRKRLGIPVNAVVVGSFQKDGNGWGEGLEPKTIKGPDIFLKTVEILKTKCPEIGRASCRERV